MARKMRAPLDFLARMKTEGADTRGCPPPPRRVKVKGSREEERESSEVGLGSFAERCSRRPRREVVDTR